MENQSAVVVRFHGNPDELLPRYAAALRQFREVDAITAPSAIFAGRSQEAPNALVVVILWPPGVDHGVMGGFIFKRLAELGLPPPTVDHLEVQRAGFGEIALVR